MTRISIKDINEHNYNNLLDDASYLQDLSDNEVNAIHGGGEPLFMAVIGALWLGYKIGKELSRWF
ncbi:hypothetical protein [Anabaena sp. 4-3]|uniref:hypothetical protein n=1 Tax=Anabaena sp. 4-3 TaxID=1811979 RepID=UPI00082C779A|nr:hypothetical protein [Anabaena sp. 4-3]